MTIGICGWHDKTICKICHHCEDCGVDACIHTEPVSYTHLTLPTTPYV